jgi:hypothetical protein
MEIETSHRNQVQEGEFSIVGHKSLSSESGGHNSLWRVRKVPRTVGSRGDIRWLGAG